jgi:hypothetical protein
MSLEASLPNGDLAEHCLLIDEIARLILSYIGPGGHLGFCMVNRSFLRVSRRAIFKLSSHADVSLLPLSKKAFYLSNLASAKWAISECGMSLNGATFQLAARACCIKINKKEKEEKKEEGEKKEKEASAKWAISECGMSLKEEVEKNAELISMFEFLLSLNCPIDLRTSAELALRANTTGLNWLLKHKKCIIDSKVMTNACVSGNLEVCKMLRDNTIHNTPWNANCCIAAAKLGHNHILKWLRGTDVKLCYPWNQSVADILAERGDLKMLQWCREECFHGPVPWGLKTSAYAAKEGHFDMLVYMRRGAPSWGAPPSDNICNWDKSAVTYAVLGGHNTMLEWMVCKAEPPCDIDKTGKVMAHAAAKGNIEAFKLLHSLGTPFDKKHCLKVAIGSMKEFLKTL